MPLASFFMSSLSSESGVFYNLEYGTGLSYKKGGSRVSEPFVTINGQPFYKDDWIHDSRVVDVKMPARITNVTKESDEVTVWMQSPMFDYYMLTLGEFTAFVMDGIFVKVEKPKYHIGEKFRNRFTYRSIEIMDIPRIRNELNGEYVYFVLEFTPAFGYNHNVRTESEITYFFINEGADRV